MKEFNYKANITKHNKVNICKKSIIKKITGQTLVGHLKWAIPESIINGNPYQKIAFLRGFFDGDGTISNNNVRFFSVNKSGLKQIYLLLLDLDFNPSIHGPETKINRKPFYYVRVPAKERENFLNRVQPIAKRPDYLRG
ncbi:MAG: LAGLIDADG family homing endonuclease [Nanoarchaeota archaeon]